MDLARLEAIAGRVGRRMDAHRMENLVPIKGKVGDTDHPWKSYLHECQDMEHKCGPDFKNVP